MFKNIFRFVILTLVVALLFVIVTNIWVVYSTKDQVIKAAELEDTRTALILGTSYNIRQGVRNPFFTSRILTGVQLYKDSLISDFILSGSATDYYNEPKAMAKSLREVGIPNEILTSDTLGVRTLSSIIRYKEVYKKEKVLIITQRFHAYRALFISNYYNLDAVAIPTKDVSAKGKFGVLVREIFARPLAVIDLFLLQRRP